MIIIIIIIINRKPEKVNRRDVIKVIIYNYYKCLRGKHKTPPPQKKHSLNTFSFKRLNELI